MSPRKTSSQERPTATANRKPAEHHEIFTAKRLIIFFLSLEILIIALMYPTYRGRWHMNQAKGALKEEKWEKAYHHYEWLGKHTPAPKAAAYQREMGITCMALGRHDDALKHFKNLVRIAGEEKGSHRLLGQAHLKKGEDAEARASFERELEINPTDTEAVFHLGEIAFRQKKYTEAASFFSRVAFLPEFQEKLKPYWETIMREVFDIQGEA